MAEFSILDGLLADIGEPEQEELPAATSKRRLACQLSRKRKHQQQCACSYAKQRSVFSSSPLVRWRWKRCVPRSDQSTCHLRNGRGEECRRALPAESSKLLGWQPDELRSAAFVHRSIRQPASSSTLGTKQLKALKTTLCTRCLPDIMTLRTLPFKHGGNICPNARVSVHVMPRASICAC